MTSLMGEMVNSDRYIELTGIGDFRDESIIAKDYDSPTRAYLISIPSFEVLYQKYQNADTSSFDELSDGLKEQVKGWFNFYTVLFRINADHVGIDELSIFSTLFANKKFDGKITSSKAYLYIFETGRPIVVVFEPFGDKQFTAKGYFLFVNDVSTLSKVKEIFEPYGCDVENVK